MAAKPATQTPETPVDGSTPITMTLTFDQWKAMTGGGGSVSADGVIQSNHNPPLISAFNPEGELARPRPTLVGTVFLLNTRLQAEELTREEIDLLNALRPGAYGPYGAWVVENLSPGMGRPEDRKIQITFPNKDKDQRDGLVPLAQMLRQMVEESSALVPARA